MNLEVTEEWLLSFDEKPPDPSGYVTPRERAEVARRRESAQTAALQVLSAQRSAEAAEADVPPIAAKP